MTTLVTPTQKAAENDSNHSGWFVTWNNMPQASQGIPGSQLVGFADHSFQIEGTFGAGGSVAILGSNDGVNFRVLNDAFGNPLNNITSPGVVKQVLESAAFVVPAVNGGDVTTAVIVTALFRRSKVYD